MGDLATVEFEGLYCLYGLEMFCLCSGAVFVTRSSILSAKPKLNFVGIQFCQPRSNRFFSLL